MKKRPTGITILFWFYLLFGILSLLWSGAVLGMGSLTALFGGLFGADNMTAFGSSSAWSGYVGLFAAVIQIIVAFGLAALKKWAWYLALIGVGLTIVQGIAGILAGGIFAFMCGSVGLIVPAIVLFYLLKQDVRAVFGVGTS